MYDNRKPYPDRLAVKIAAEIFGALGPLREAHHVEVGQDELTQVLGRHHVGKEQGDHLAPNNVLTAETKIPNAETEIGVGLAHTGLELLIFFDGIGIVIVERKHGVVVEATAHYPFAAFAPAPLSRQIEQMTKVRTVGGLGPGVGQSGLIKTRYSRRGRRFEIA